MAITRYWTYHYRANPRDLGRRYIASTREEIPEVVRPYAIEHTVSVPDRVYYEKGFDLRRYLEALEKR